MEYFYNLLFYFAIYSFAGWLLFDKQNQNF